jgi:hypothetical protein
MERSTMKLCTSIITAVSVCVLSCGHALGQAPADSELLPDPAEMARVEASVDKALEFLVSRQNADGSWPSQLGPRNNGVTAVCMLAFLGRGHTPRRGPLSPVVDRALAYLISTQADNGLYASPSRSHGPMYDHALATLAVIEACGYVPEPEVRRSAQRAVDLIVKSQNDRGGWRYQPVPQDADLSVTVMQVVALRAAVNARLHVPEKTLERALKYVLSCAVPDGGFGYQGPNNPGPARTAAGVLSLQLLGAFDDPAVRKGLDYLERATEGNRRPEHYWYMAYYSMQAHFQAGGADWQRWHPRLREQLLDSQLPDGSWPGFNEEKIAGESRAYSTAMGAMCLEVYMHYLPAYQR